MTTPTCVPLGRLTGAKSFADTAALVITRQVSTTASSLFIGRRTLDWSGAIPSSAPSFYVFRAIRRALGLDTARFPLGRKSNRTPTVKQRDSSLLHALCE